MAIMYYLQLKRYHKPPREALQTPREICLFSCCKTKHAILNLFHGSECVQLGGVLLCVF